MKTRALFTLFAFSTLISVLAVQSLAQPTHLDRTPVTPGVVGTYYYEGYDSPNDRYVFISTTGTYYYVYSDGFTTVGETSAVPLASPYRAVVTASTTNFQFYNNNADNYTLTTITGSDGAIITATNFSVRSGTWFASDVTFNITTTDTSAISLEGVSGTFSAADAANYTGNVVKYADGSARVIYDRPAVFSGTNVNAIVDSVTAGSRQAVSLRNGATAYISGGTLSKTVAPVVTITGTVDGVVTTSTAFDTGSSEVIYLVGNQEGHGSSSHFYGEDLTIIADGPNIRAITMGDGNNTVTLKNSSITSITSKTNTSEAIYLNDNQGQGGNHFHGENLLITNNAGRVVALGVNGENSFTLVSSTMINNGTGAAIAWNATAASTGDRFTSSVVLQDTTVLTTANYSPIFQQIGNRATITVTDSILTTSGVGSSGIRLIAQNDNYDSTRNTVLITNSVLTAEKASAIDVNIDANNAALYGQAGGGGKNIGTKVEDSYEIIIQSSIVTGEVAVLRVAAGGSGTSTYTNFTNVFVYDSTLTGGIQMVAGQLAGFACGASLTLTASNSILNGGIYITGSTMFQRSNQAIFYVRDSTWTGDIILTNRGNLTLQFNDTPIEGSLSASGSSHVQLRLNNSPITGNINTNDTAVITGQILGEGAIASVTASGGLIDLTLEHAPTDGISADGTGSIALRIGNDVAFENGIHLSGSSAIALTLRDAIRLDSDLVILDRATFSLATARNDTVTLAGNVSLAGIWQIPSKTVLAGNLTITDHLGTIALIGARPDILTLTHGLSGNGRLDIRSIDGIDYGTPEFRVIHDQTETFAPDALILSHPVDYGLAAYTLENRPDGAYLVDGLGAAGAAVFNSQALAAEDWFASLVPVNQHLSDLRRINGGIFSGESGGAPGQGDTGAFWLKGRADTTRVNLSGGTLDFDSRTIGLTAGADARWDYDTATLSTGIFLDTSRIDRDFCDSADGSTNAVGGGIYMLYQHRKGFFASAIGRFDTYQTTLDTNDPNNAMNADYRSQAGGLALELGWRFTLGSGWWYEPAWQIAFARLPGVSYSVRSNITENKNTVPISADDGSATQNVFRFSVGKDISQKWNVRGHLAAAKVKASGGAFTAQGAEKGATFTLDGDRIEASIGIGRQIGRIGRITLDAIYTDADSYERPCAFFLGYNHAW